MLFVGRCSLTVQDRAIEGDFRTSREWMSLHPGYQPLGILRQAMFLFGPRETGPALLLTVRDPVGDEMATPAHHHRTNTFRAMIGDMPKQSKNGPDWLDGGDFLAMDANVPYAERLGGQGHWSIVMDADRRGGAPLLANADPAESSRQYARTMTDVFGFNWPLWEQDEDAPDMLGATFGQVSAKRRLRGSLDDPSWDRISDGSAIGAVLIGDADDGPAVIMSRNAPGSVEAPSGSYATDRFRLVCSGESTIGNRRYEAGQFRFTEADVVEGPVVHGPEGSTQIMILADRRARFSADTTDQHETTARLHEIADLVWGARSGLAAV